MGGMGGTEAEIERADGSDPQVQPQTIAVQIKGK